jgi:hypothetical protein
MGKETGKAMARRLREGYFETIFVGAGIDIGCGADPVTSDCLAWDRPQGDAQFLPGLLPEQFDWVYSSHCLEHLCDPWRALLRWWEILKPGGALLIAVPDEDLYEQGYWPSRFNPEHRWSFTLHKTHSWSPVSINLSDLILTLPGHRLGWLRTCEDGYDYSGGVWDRTGGPAEAHIEALVWKTEGIERVSGVGCRVSADGHLPAVGSAEGQENRGEAGRSLPAMAREETPGAEVHALLRELPNKLGEGWDWFEAPTNYPLHAKILGALGPRRYVEFGTHLGYSLVSALAGAPSIREVAWADNESYIPDSNRLASENMGHLLRRMHHQLMTALKRKGWT